MISEELEDYGFIEAPNKIVPTLNIKKQTNASRSVWSIMKHLGFSFYGVVRNWTAIFGLDGQYICLHHFINEEPIEELFGPISPFSHHIVPASSEVTLLLDALTEMDMSLSIPEQTYLDAVQSELMGGDDWHLASPLHKYKIVGRMTGITIGIEAFAAKMTFPPYGVKEELPWPSLKWREELVQLELFSTEPYRITVKPQHTEEISIAESIPEHLDRLADEAIARAFRENDLCVVPASGGKDSSVVMQKAIRYKLQNPNTRFELIIISADTGVDNPLMQAHVRRLKQAVEGLGFPFHIVMPKITESYMVTVFGRGYTPPSTPNHTWCISRLKTGPGRRALEAYTKRHQTICQLMGLRTSESVSRAQSIEKHYGDQFYGNHVVNGIRTCSPIQNWSATDVVTYLVRNEAPWKGYGNHHLINLYGSSMGGLTECPTAAAILSDNEAIRSCTRGATRMGCWSCTVVSEDTSLRNLTIGLDGRGGEYPELEPYYRMRAYFKGSQDIRYMGMTGYKRDNHGRTRFEPGFGNLTIDMRTSLLQKMKELDIPILDREIDEIFREVNKRECTEGLPVSNRFRLILRSFYSTDPLIIGGMFDPVFNPSGMIDRRTEEDLHAIDRIWKQIESGELIPYWA